MAVLVETHQRCMDHNAGLGHPENPERLRRAVLDGIAGAELGDAVVQVEPRPARREGLELVHPARYLDALQRLSEKRGGEIDPDTRASAGSWDAAVLAEQGERVLLLDWDAHHGNGTQDVFYDDPRVMYVSTHQSPLYPGSGELDETGSGEAEGTTVNIPFPSGTTGDAYEAAERALDLAPEGRLVMFLEGGYDLDALSWSAAACVAVMAGAEREGEPRTSGGPGRDAVEEARRRLRQG